MASRRFINIKTFKHGVVAFTTLASISVNSDVQEIAASGDADKVDTFVAKGKSATRGEVQMQDPIQAEALNAAGSADITFQGEPETGGVATVATIKKVTFFGVKHTMMHNGVWGCSIPYRAYDPAGGALVSFADAV